MKTGDLARYNVRDELVHVGRVDFQIKIHGQRVETTEIENTIINFSPDKIFNCLVTKNSQNDDLLIAYVISNELDIDTEEIRDYCNRYFRQYMIPSYFVVLYVLFVRTKKTEKITHYMMIETRKHRIINENLVYKSTSAFIKSSFLIEMNISRMNIFSVTSDL